MRNEPRRTHGRAFAFVSLVGSAALFVSAAGCGAPGGTDARHEGGPGPGATGRLREGRRCMASVFAVKADGTGTLLDGRPFLVVGLRCSNALISDEKTRELVDNLDTFASHGVNTVSVFLQGSRFGDVKGYDEDATLSAVHAARLARIIEAADARGMVVLVGCLYYGGSRAKWPSWGEADAARAVANTVRWLSDNDYRNVFIDVNNESMASEFDDARLIAAGKAVDARHVIATSGRRTPPNADLSLHHGRTDIPGKYYVESEGTMPGYWGSYSKRKGYYNYINIGVYTDEQRRQQKRRTSELLAQGKGYMCASTWLQCVPPHGPNLTPGGMGTRDDPGIRWWLLHVRSIVGPYSTAPHRAPGRAAGRPARW